MLTFYSRIVVAYDASDLSKKAVKMAAELAKQDSKIELRFVSVFNDTTTIGNFGIYNEELMNSIKEATKESLKKVTDHLEELPNITYTNFLIGNPGRMIVSYAKEHDCDLIVMGSRGLTGLKEVFLGSTSHYVVQQAHCPVLIAK